MSALAEVQPSPEPQESARRLFRPSEYTAMIVKALSDDPSLSRGRSVCELGCGAGTALALAGILGASRLCGSDVDEDALGTTEETVRDAGVDVDLQLRLGSLWEPFENESFDLVLCNPPHFPAEAVELSGRKPTWSAGGADGRRLLDPILQGLGERLTPGGSALLTHNTICDLGKTIEILRRVGLRTRSIDRILVYLPPEKLSAVDRDAVNRRVGLVAVGRHMFAEVRLLHVRKT